MIDKAIFHIGCPKTGTSIIQSHLAQNRKVLRDKGVLYPITISSDKNLYKTFESHHLLAYSWANWSTFNRFNTDWFFERVNQTGIKYSLHTLLLSAENTYWLPTQVVAREKPDREKFWKEKNDYVQRIFNDFKGYDTKIIIYLRRQDRWIESWYNQQIKNGNNLPSDMMEVVEHHDYLLDYEKLLEVWANSFGKENIIVRVYEKEQLENGLLQDFLNVTNLGNADEYPVVKKPRFNAQLSRDAVEFLNVCNALSLSEEDNRWLKILVRKITNQFDQNIVFKNQSFLSPTQRVDVLNYYKEMNQRIAEKYLERDDKKLFYELWPNDAELWVPYSGLSPEFNLKVLVPMMIELRKELLTDFTKKNKVASKYKCNIALIDKVLEPIKNRYRRNTDEKYWNKYLWDYH